MKKKIFGLGSKTRCNTFNLSLFQKYVQKNEDELLTQILFGFSSREHINLMTVSNLQKHETINIMSADDTEITGVKFEELDLNMPHFYKVNMSLCTEDLILKYNFDLSTKRINSEDEFVKKLVNDIVSKTQNAIENRIWTGNAAEDGMNGLLTLANSNEQTIKVPKGQNNWETLVNVIKNIPDDIIDNAELFCGSDMYGDIAKYISGHKLMLDVDIIKSGDTIIVPGTDFRLHRTQGLYGTGQIIAADPRNLVYIVGLDEKDKKVNDADITYNMFKMLHCSAEMEYRVYINICINAQIVFPDQVVVSEK